MPEATVVETPVVMPPDTISLGWRAGLPDDLKQNTDLVNYKTVGDFTKEALSWKGKVGELEGKLSDSIPKLPDDATDEDRNTYYDALGRPKTADDYVLEGEDKNAPEFNTEVRKVMHSTGQTPQQALSLNRWWNKFFGDMVKAQKDLNDAEMNTAAQKFKSEMGDKYEANVELAQRLAKNKVGDSFDSRFSKLDANGKQMVIELTLKYAALTGEDTSPQGGHSSNSGAPKPEDAWMSMYDNPVGR